MSSRIPTAEQALDHLPGHVFVIDEVGKILVANARAGELAERDPADLVGDSVLQYVDEEAAWAYASAMAYAMDGGYADTFSGPIRIRVIAPSGLVTRADLWTANRLHDPDVGGVVCLLTPESAAMGVGDALAAAGSGESLDDVASRVAEAMGGFPVCADAAILRADAQHGWSVVANHGLPSPVVDGSLGTAIWDEVQLARERRLYGTVDDVPKPVGDLVAGAGYHALWVVPCTWRDDACSAVIVLGRPFPGEPTPNELTHVHEAATLLALLERTS